MHNVWLNPSFYTDLIQLLSHYLYKYCSIFWLDYKDYHSLPLFQNRPSELCHLHLLHWLVVCLKGCVWSLNRNNDTLKCLVKINVPTVNNKPHIYSIYAVINLKMAFRCWKWWRNTSCHKEGARVSAICWSKRWTKVLQNHISKLMYRCFQHVFMIYLMEILQVISDILRAKPEWNICLLESKHN